MAAANINFNVRTEAFDGPLDLLLHLIEKHEVDIFDIPISGITEQYLLYIENFIGTDMDSLSSFLLLAATLLSIKARLLLPRNTSGAEDEGEAADPRAELAMKLLLYKEYKEKALIFKEREKTGNLAYYRERDESACFSHAIYQEQDIIGIVSPKRLRQIFEDVLARQERRIDKIRAGFGTIQPEKYTIAEKMSWLEEKLRRGRISFYALFDGDFTKEEMVVTFLALLEMAKQRRAIIVQNRLFDEITITGGTGEGHDVI